jgi:hypothetical protein
VARRIASRRSATAWNARTRGLASRAREGGGKAEEWSETLGWAGDRPPVLAADGQGIWRPRAADCGQRVLLSNWAAPEMVAKSITYNVDRFSPGTAGGCLGLAVAFA